MRFLAISGGSGEFDDFRILGHVAILTSPRLRPQQGRANHRDRVKLSSYLEPTVIQTASSNLEQELQGGKLKSSRGRGVRTPREQFPPKFPQFLGDFAICSHFKAWGTRERAKRNPLKRFGENGGRHRD